ncbi:MAG: DUF1800 domain-containing protein [Okeania sp. SIO3I5]|uniref:DUF1800 domain-containing protein n=1 Tax=Okeania sp. SIO3I5 TaxID=2607805 RepID=UPI0013B9141C|nr:DUF1800 domain-containing protein [Okeania sp. SIO3I5]NEQ39587.1 DUF1800 domain-containing protein [Okeania sp. SIO3I5]
MKKASRYWIISLLLGLIILLGLPSPSYADRQSITTKTIHVLNRLSFGPKAGDIQRIQSMGIDNYIQSQLRPETIRESQQLTNELSTLKTLYLNPVQLFNEYGPLPPKQEKQLTEKERQARNKRMRRILNQARKANFFRAISSNRQLQEVMVNFWFNHFNISVSKGRPIRLWIGAYERDAIRPYALGNFRDLLGATAYHPAMLFYLDNWLNTAPGSQGVRGRFKGLNENYARELMELHTMGVNGGYKQQDIITLAKIFTGWGIQRRSGDGSGFKFYANRHDNSDKIFLGIPIKGGGIEEGEKALDILATHPSTARFISYKLAQYFVADQPPETLVNRLAKRFQETNGNIRFVLETLFSSSEFWSEKYYGSKFKTPYQYIISAARATGTDKPRFGRINGMLFQLGMPLYRCATPDGYKNTKEAWLNPDAIMRRTSFATIISRGNLNQGKPTPINHQQLSLTLGNNFSSKTQAVISNSPNNLQAALILGSPEMMEK